jgi:hypothetical protein
MKRTLIMSLCCLAAFWPFCKGVDALADELRKSGFWTVSDRILVLKCRFTGDEPRRWLIVEAHNGVEFDERGFDPSYTRMVTDYKPTARKMENGQWEVTFSSEGAEDLP